MIGFDFISVDQDQIIQDVIDEYIGNIDASTTCRGLDLSIIEERATITNMDFSPVYIDILNPQGQALDIS